MINGCFGSPPPPRCGCGCFESLFLCGCRMSVIGNLFIEVFAPLKCLRKAAHQRVKPQARKSFSMFSFATCASFFSSRKLHSKHTCTGKVWHQPQAQKSPHMYDGCCSVTDARFPFTVCVLSCNAEATFPPLPSMTWAVAAEAHLHSLRAGSPSTRRQLVLGLMPCDFATRFPQSRTVKVSVSLHVWPVASCARPAVKPQARKSPNMRSGSFPAAAERFRPLIFRPFCLSTSFVTVCFLRLCCTCLCFPFMDQSLRPGSHSTCSAVRARFLQPGSAPNSFPSQFCPSIQRPLRFDAPVFVFVSSVSGPEVPQQFSICAITPA